MNPVMNPDTSILTRAFQEAFLDVDQNMSLLVNIDDEVSIFFAILRLDIFC